MAKIRVAVIGAGLMGHGIAQVFALAGHDVALTDAHAPTLANAKDRILTNLKELGDDLKAVERGAARAPSSPRPWGTRTSSSRRCARISASSSGCSPTSSARRRRNAIFASNTSVIPITAIMGRLENRARALGTHWWNPPYLVPLVEVIGTRWTAPAAIELTMKLHAEIGKTPVHVKKDVPGFVGNRLQHALWREAISLIENDICDAETVDTVIKAAFGRRLGVLGPLENADLVGTDLTLAIHQTVLPAIDSRPGPSPYLEKLVARGKLGMKSGEGFRTWTAEQQAELRARVLTAPQGRTGEPVMDEPVGGQGRALRAVPNAELNVRCELRGHDSLCPLYEPRARKDSARTP